MAAITQSDEGLSETLLGLLEAVLGELRKQNSYITNMYIKSENASSYHRNFKFSIKSINPNVQSLCPMIAMSPVYYQVLFYCFVTG